MKWGKKKPSLTSPSSSHPHLISHMFPLSWLSKFKQPINKPKPKSKQKLQEVKPLSARSAKPCSSYRESKFYTQDEDGFWKLITYGKENMEIGSNGRSKAILKTVPQDHYCGNCKSQAARATKRSQNLNTRNFGIGVQDQSKEAPRRAEISPRKDTMEITKEQNLKRTYRRIIEATSELQRELDEVRNGCRTSFEKETTELELLQAMRMLAGKANEVSKDDTRPKWQKLKEAKIKEVMSKNENQRKSFHISRESQKVKVVKQSKVKVRSPRTPSRTEICKIKAIEDLKKAKVKKKIKEMEMDAKAKELGSFAVVKCSSDPRQDFRDSMVEMIVEKRIKKPEELEELLACYLTLNADEYHDLIINAFREVWCQLEDACFCQK